MAFKGRTALLVPMAAIVAASLGSTSVSAFEPVSLVAADAPIRLSVLGTYRGDTFSRNTPATPPAYDPLTRRLFVGSVDRNRIDVLDISKPALPRLVTTIDLTPYGEPNSLAVHKGLLAVAVKSPDERVEFGHVLLFRTAGMPPQLVGRPIELPVPSRLAFAPNGGRLVVTLSGAPSPDYSRDPEAGIAIIELSTRAWLMCHVVPGECDLRPNVRLADFLKFNARKDELIAAGVRIYGPGNPTVAQDANPEGLAIRFDSRRAWVTLERNNAIAEVDLERAEVADIFALGSKDHGVSGNELDASDRDGINIRNRPVRSFYSPDGIAILGAGPWTFLVTANEGDPKDTEAFSERLRVGDARYVLDPGRFPDALMLKRETELGRLQVTSVDGDMDRDGDFDQIFMLGSRSFSVWTSDGELVFDSGGTFEKRTAAAIPTYFNTAEDENVLDGRSGDRGPEPEHLAVGLVGWRTFLFVGFERIGGIIVYELTNPLGPRFVQYINNRNFALDPKDVCPEKGMPMTPECIQVGDLEPEGFAFIPWYTSPVGVPLLAVIHELSDSTTLYRIDTVGLGP